MAAPRKVNITIDRQLHCCGIREISALSVTRSGEEAMMAFCRPHYNLKNQYYPSQIYDVANYRYAIFSQALKGARYGVRFAAFIKENNLGELIETGFNINPNSGNSLKTWVWTINHDATKKWYLKQLAKEEGKVDGETVTAEVGQVLQGVPPLAARNVGPGPEAPPAPPVRRPRRRTLRQPIEVRDGLLDGSF